MRTNRRRSIKALLLLSFGTHFSSFYPKESLHDVSSQALLGLLVDRILPATPHCPGAYQAKVHHYITEIVEDCFEEDSKKIVTLGLKKLKSMGFERFNKQKQLAILNEWDRMSSSVESKKSFFQTIKSLTIAGYFSSEIGVTQALRYNPIPGKYLGCVPYKPGEVAWY